MKKSYMILIICFGITVVLLVLSNCLFLRKRLAISFVTSHEYSLKDLEFKGGLNQYEWIIIHGEDQRKNLEDEGYDIPVVDFDETFLVISRHKIRKLYYRTRCNHCLGVPDGIVVFDKKNSSKNIYYIYQIPTVLLAQGVE